jgi:hypothetical protein
MMRKKPAEHRDICIAREIVYYLCKRRIYSMLSQPGLWQPVFPGEALMKKGIMFILIMCVGMVALVMGAGMSEELAGGISLAAAIAYAVLSSDGSEDDE